MRSCPATGVAVTLLGLLAFSSALPAEHRGLGARPPTPEEAAYLSTRTTEVCQVAPTALARARVLAEAEARGLSPAWVESREGLPTAVDNSTLVQFPPIRSQGGQGSCTAWASCYYYNTFTQAMDEGYDVSGGDDDHICSPAFMYPLVNDGRDQGASVWETMVRLDDVGACSWTLKPYSDSDYTSWPSEAAWVNALQNRTQASFSIAASTPEQLQVLKQHLANGNLAVTAFNIYGTFYNYYPQDGVGINNGVYYYPDGSAVGGHAVTLVGYDDAKSYVDQRDGQTHYGAFLVANSWGTDWGVVNSTGAGTKGFFWVSYEMFLASTFGPTVYYNSDREDYRPRLYAAVGVNHSQRNQVSVRAGLSTSPGWWSYYAVDRDGGGALAVSSANRIAVDMTDGCSLIGADPVQGFGELSVDGRATTAGTIASADFYEDLDGNGVYYCTSSTDPTITVSPGTSASATGIIYPHILMLTAIANPEAVNSGGSTFLSASFADSRGHGVSSWMWSDNGAGGSFSPSAEARNPSYTAPTNTTGDALVVDLTVTATCDGAPASLANVTAHLTVRSVGIFSDVPSYYWAYPYIRACAFAGIVTGFQDGTYRPTDPVDRAGMAVYISRALAQGDANVPTGPAAPTFTDVDSDHWAYKYVEYAYAKNIVTGYGGGIYGPNIPVDRGQMAVFIARALVTPSGDAGVPDPPPTPTFPDVDTGFWAYKHIEYIADPARAIAHGYDDGKYHPEYICTRDQMAVYVQRAFELPM